MTDQAEPKVELLGLTFEGSRKTKDFPEVKVDMGLVPEDQSRFKSLLTQMDKVLGCEAGASLYLLKTGFNRSMAEGASMTKETKVELGDTLADELKALWAERLDAIKSGGPAGRSAPRGPRALTVEGVLRDIVVEAIVAAAKAKGAQVPAGKELTAMRDKLIEVKRDVFLPKAQKRFEEMSELADLVA